MRNNIKNITILFILMALFVPFNVFGQDAAGQNALFEGLEKFWYSTGFANFQFKYLAMILVGIVFIILAVKKGWEPLLLIPIGFGMIIGNIPLPIGSDEGIGIYDEGSVLNILYSGVIDGWYPPLVFLGIGAMTDFSSLISNPKLMLLGAAAQTGIFITFFGAYALGFTPEQAGAIGIIGGADGPTAIFLTSKLAPELIGTIAVEIGRAHV